MGGKEEANMKKGEHPVSKSKGGGGGGLQHLPPKSASSPTSAWCKTPRTESAELSTMKA
jgi:hypothetical protein